MATPPPGMNPQQFAAMQQQFAAEAAKRGMTPEEFSKFQRDQLTAEAAKHGMSPEQYVTQLRMRAMQQMQMQAQARAQGQGQGQPQGAPGQGQPSAGSPQPIPQQQIKQQVPVNPNNPPNPQAIAVAKWLRSQNLKTRTCILDGQRKEMFKVKRAIRALESPAYAKASKKAKSGLPPVTDRASAEHVFKLLPLSLLALRVSKHDPHEGHNHGPSKQKRVKGLWTVKIEQHQETDPMMHYVWLYEGPQWKQKAMAAGVVAAIFAVVLFPLWPIMLRQGVWYLSVGMMGLLGLFFAMSIFRLILFCVTYFAVPPGLWLFPNLFEDVGFFDSFKPVWGWQEKKKKSGKKPKKAAAETASTTAAASTKASSPTTPATTATSVQPASSGTGATSSSSVAPSSGSGEVTKRNHLAPRVEDVEDE